MLSDLLTVWGPLVVLMTWGSLLFQIAFPFLLFNRYTKIVALLGILSFHIAIGLLMGLPWFSLTMIAVDAIFIKDHTYRRLHGFVTPRPKKASAAGSGNVAVAEHQSSVPETRPSPQRRPVTAGSR